MSGVRKNGLVGLAVAGSLLFSTSAVAANNAPRAAGPVSPWASLSMMSGSVSASAFCGAAASVSAAAATVAQGGCVLPQIDAPATAAQAPASRPIPVPPVEPAGSFYLDPLLLGLGVVALGALVYFLLIKKGDDDPVSPG